MLAASGCIAVSGGLEVASDRLLKLIAKGVTVEQVARVNENFNRAGVMVHAYLMYGFPTQTAQETIDSLEVVRQMFEQNVMQSAFWHRFAMTAHSPVGMNPDAFKVENLSKEIGTFANNDLVHKDPTGTDHGLFSEGLKKSLYKYLHGVCLDWSLSKWFDHKVPKTSLSPTLIKDYLAKPDFREMKPNYAVIWIGGAVSFDASKNQLVIHSKLESHYISADTDQGTWLAKTLLELKPENGTTTYSSLQKKYEDSGLTDFLLFWYSGLVDELREVGLIVV